MIKRFIIKAVLIVSSSLFFFLQEASAQRTSRGQYYFDLSASASVITDASLGGVARFGQYLLSSRWEVGVQGMLKRDGIRYYPVFAEASYLYRFCSDRSRAVHLYGGIGILMGLETSLPAPVTDDTGYSDDSEGGVNVDFSEVQKVTSAPVETAFIYGLQPRLEAEVFLARKVALTANLSMPLTLGSAHRAFNLTGSVGLRFNL